MSDEEQNGLKFTAEQVQNTVRLAQSGRQTTSQPTGALQFAQRRVSTGPAPFDVGSKFILQQQWLVQEIENHVVVATRYEWRDVPSVLESEEEASGEKPNEGEAEAMTDKTLVERLARAVRRRKFERAGRLNCLDSTVTLTDNEIDEARVAVEFLLDFCARQVKSGWLTAQVGTIGDADYGEALCAEMEQKIRGLIDG